MVAFRCSLGAWNLELAAPIFASCSPRNNPVINITIGRDISHGPRFIPPLTFMQG